MNLYIVQCSPGIITVYNVYWIYMYMYIDVCTHVHPQPTIGKFPPEGTELGEGAIPLPGVCWTAMQPHSSGRLLSLPLWLSLQYLGEGGGDVARGWSQGEGGGARGRGEGSAVCD